MSDDKKLQVREAQATLTRWIYVEYMRDDADLGWQIAFTTLHETKELALRSVSVKGETRFRIYQVEIPFIAPVTE